MARQTTSDEKRQLHTIEERSDGMRGKITLSDDVVAKVAGMAARDIPGIFSIGRSRIIGWGGDDPTRGVAVEVGQQEAAIDLEAIIEHGCDIRRVAGELRQRIASEVDKMAGRKVVEVNINIVDIHLPEQEAPAPAPEPSRVQ